MMNYNSPSRQEIELKNTRRFKRTNDKKKNCTTCVRCSDGISNGEKCHVCHAITDEEMIKRKTIYTRGISFIVYKTTVCRCHRPRNKSKK